MEIGEKIWNSFCFYGTIIQSIFVWKIQLPMGEMGSDFMYKVLIVDDEKIERMVVKQVLQNNFQNVCIWFEGENGVEALEILDKHIIDIAILDIKMPGMSGIEVARQIKVYQPHCKIIMHSGFTYFTYARDCISVGVMEFLVKPCPEKDMIEAIEKAVHLIEEDGIGQLVENTKEAAAANWMVKIEKKIERRYADELSVEHLASCAGFSPHYFSRMFKQAFGMNYVDYITKVRLEKACEILTEGDTPIKEVCFMVGYSEPSYFTRVFKKMYGISPSEYQKNVTKIQKS